VVIGLPFANLGSRELQERMRFVKERAAASTKSGKAGGGRDAGIELYENMCMKVGTIDMHSAAEQLTLSLFE